MSAPTPKPGERWRVSHRQDHEGVVTEVIDGGVRLRDDSGTMWTLRERGGWFPAERLPDPEPEYVVGGLYLDAEGDVLRRFEPSADGEFAWGWPSDRSASLSDRSAKRPLRRLVVEEPK